MKPIEKLRTLIPFEHLEQEAQKQVWDCLECEFVEKLALMPDCHPGYALPIGGVALTIGVISPNYVGYDIGCGMVCYITKVKMSEVDDRERINIFNKIMNTIPVGKGKMYKRSQSYSDFKSASGDKQLTQEVNNKLFKQIGTLGGGNHFIEIGENREGYLSVVVHSGSRKPGHLICSHYLKEAKKKNGLPKGFLRLDEESAQNYIEDMNWALNYSFTNRYRMAIKIFECIGIRFHIDNWQLSVNENHNTADVLDDGIHVLHRKGATPANEGEYGVIPGNMRDGTYITKGLGNEEFLCSASHGAGRKGSRKWAKETFTLDDLESDMKGIISPLNSSLIDEIPGAYKDINEVIKAQDGVVVDVIDHIKPIINIKG